MAKERETTLPRIKNIENFKATEIENKSIKNW